MHKLTINAYTIDIILEAADFLSYSDLASGAHRLTRALLSHRWENTTGLAYASVNPRCRRSTQSAFDNQSVPAPAQRTPTSKHDHLLNSCNQLPQFLIHSKPKLLSWALSWSITISKIHNIYIVKRYISLSFEDTRCVYRGLYRCELLNLKEILYIVAANEIICNDSWTTQPETCVWYLIVLS